MVEWKLDFSNLGISPERILLLAGAHQGISGFPEVDNEHLKEINLFSIGRSSKGLRWTIEEWNESEETTLPIKAGRGFEGTHLGVGIDTLFIGRQGRWSSYDSPLPSFPVQLSGVFFGSEEGLGFYSIAPTIYFRHTEIVNGWEEVCRSIAERNAFFRARKLGEFVPLDLSVCPMCGRQFEPTRASMIYDSELCSDRARKRRGAKKK